VVAEGAEGADDDKSQVFKGLSEGCLSCYAGVVGTATLRKNGITWVDATTGDQTSGVTLSTPLTAGTHVLTSEIYDPLGTLVTGAANPTINLLVWDRPTLQVNGVSSSSTFIIDRTNNVLFTGTKFNLGACTSSVTMKVDGTTITPDTVTDPTKFSFTMPTLATGASHTVELTQTYTGSVVTGSPTIVSNYIIDNSTTLDVTPPDAPIVASPAASGTIYTLKPIITGQAEPLATIKMRIDDGTTVTANSTTVTAGATGSFTFAAADWATGLSGGGLLANKTYTIQVAATDSAGNISAWSDSGYNLVTPASTAYAKFSPTAGVTTASSVNYSKTATAVFDVQMFDLSGTQLNAGALAGALAADFVVTNGTVVLTTTPANISNAAANFVITVTPTAAGAVTINSPANAFTVGSDSTSAATTYTFIKDATGPVLTGGISSVGGTSTAAVGGTFKVVLTATEALSSTFTPGSIAFTFTGGSSPAASIIAAPAGTPQNGLTATSNGAYLSENKLTWTAYYNYSSTPTSVSMVVGAGTVTDLATNNNTAMAAQVRTFDTTAAPVVTAGMLASTATLVTKASPILFTTTFAEAVSGMDVSDYDVTNGVISAFAATPTVCTLTVIPGEGPTPVKVTIKSGTVVTDLVGNTSTFSGNVSGVNFLTRTFDSTAPRVLSLASSTAAPTSTDDKPTNKTSIPCSLVFSEAVTGLTAASFQVENGAISGLTGSGSVYTFNIDVAAPTTVDKKVRAVLMAGKVADSVTNLNSSVAVLLRNYDGTVPTLDFGTPSLALSSVNSASGTASGVTATTLTHSGFTASALVGHTVTMGGSTMVITANTTTVLTGAAWVGGTPSAGAYTVKPNDAKATFIVTVNAGASTSDVLATKFDQTKLVLIGGTLDSVTQANVTVSGTSRLQTFTVVATLPRGAGNVVTLQALPGVVTDLAGNKNATVSGVLTVPGNG
jgi:hypothetical protein